MGSNIFSWIDSFKTTLTYSNPILWMIGICSIVALTIFIERFVTIKKSEINTNQFIISLRKIIQDHRVMEAIAFCDQTRGSISTIVKAGLVKHHRPKEDIETNMELAGLIEIARLEKNAKILSMIAHITPLIGLLGTVLGFIEAFSEMRRSGLMDISTAGIGKAMEYALVTTAAGLAVAIPAVIAYNYLVSRIQSLVLEIQITSSEVVDLILSEKEYEV